MAARTCGQHVAEGGVEAEARRRHAHHTLHQARLTGTHAQQGSKKGEKIGELSHYIFKRQLGPCSS